MTGTIEKAGRALCVARGHNPNRRFEEYGQSPHAYWQWELFTDEVKLVIRAVREPTDEMKLAGIEASPMGRVEYDDGGFTGKKVSYDTERCAEIFTAMIDELLKDLTNGKIT